MNMASVNIIVKQRSRESKDKRECTTRGRSSVFNPRATTITIVPRALSRIPRGATIDLSLRWNSRRIFLSFRYRFLLRLAEYNMDFRFIYSILIFLNISNKFFDF